MGNIFEFSKVYLCKFLKSIAYIEQFKHKKNNYLTRHHKHHFLL